MKRGTLQLQIYIIVAIHLAVEEQALKIHRNRTNSLVLRTHPKLRMPHAAQHRCEFGACDQVQNIDLNRRT